MREYLVKLRNERNETQQNVADAVGLSRQYYAMIESGSRQKKMDIILATSLAAHFGIALAEMIALEKDGAAEEKAALEQGKTTINAVRQRHGLVPIKDGCDQRLKKFD